MEDQNSALAGTCYPERVKFILTRNKGFDKLLRLRNWCWSGSVQFFSQWFESPA